MPGPVFSKVQASPHIILTCRATRAAKPADSCPSSSTGQTPLPHDLLIACRPSRALKVPLSSWTAYLWTSLSLLTRRCACLCLHTFFGLDAALFRKPRRRTRFCRNSVCLCRGPRHVFQLRKRRAVFDVVLDAVVVHGAEAPERRGLLLMLERILAGVEIRLAGFAHVSLRIGIRSRGHQCVLRHPPHVELQHRTGPA